MKVEMEFIEAPIFSKLIHNYLNDDEYTALQWELILHPEMGSLIPESRGLRKLRWGSKGRGKRGGIRIIYYYKMREDQIWLLTVYVKNEVENIPVDILKKIREKLDQ
jgi:mRNA-degrading endonuclease RelE of RelBE toxin-antitoxin system